MVFRRLSVFAGSFALKMATDAVSEGDLSQEEATELLGSLVSKSLVQFNIEGAHGSYRLLDTTRSYAADRLKASGEARWMAGRHARLILRLLESTSGEWRPVELLDDAGAAIEWSLSDEGEPEFAAALAAASAPVWLKAGLLMECRYWATRVLESLSAPVLGAQRRLAIQSALASAETFTFGFTDRSFEIWRDALASARSLDNIEQQLACLVVLWAHKIRSPEFEGALSLARLVEELANPIPDPGVHALADWMVGITHHHLGQLAAARPYLERSLAGDTLEARQAMLAQFGYDRRIPTMGVLSNLHWLSGGPDEALRIGAAAVDEARRSPYPVPLCEALTWQALNHHLRGDDPAAAETLLDEALLQARPHFIESYVGLSLALKGLNAAAHNDADDLVTQGLELLSKSKYEVFHPLFRTELARIRTQRGDTLGEAEISALIDLDAAEDWSSAEVRRNLGEVLLARGDRARAAQFFAAAVDCAERQGALGWALRAATSLTRSATDPDERKRSRERLSEVLARFAEGQGTADHQAARRLLAT
jgi:predicted negative regulator of RcsB-dependent stress response